VKRKIRINPIAISDILEIKAYIFEDHPGAAVKFGNDIYSKIEELADFPEMGPRLGTRTNLKTDYRYIICGNYLIFYKIEAEFVSIYRVLNGVRDYMSVLFEVEFTGDTN